MTKNITISVPDELHAKLQENKDVSPSGVCQKALKETLANKNELAKKGAARLLMKQLNRLSAYEDECYNAGQKWAANEASLEELQDAFEEGNIFDHDIFFNLVNGSVPVEIINIDAEDGSNQLFSNFFEGARDMWSEMEVLLRNRI